MAAEESVLYGVACPSSSACMAVGYSRHDGFSSPLVERWNRGRWTIQRTPSFAGFHFVVLDGVSCPSTSACTAVGYRGRQAGAGATLVESWDGHRWTTQASRTPSKAAFTSLAGVSCSSTVNCVAVGVAGAETLAERWQRGRWTIQRTPNPSKASFATLSGVSCSSARTCMSAGFYDTSSPLTLAERWNHGRWAIHRTLSSAQAEFDGVSCMAANACMAVGTVFVGGDKHTLAERWNGRQWVRRYTPR